MAIVFPSACSAVCLFQVSRVNAYPQEQTVSGCPHAHCSFGRFMIAFAVVTVDRELVCGPTEQYCNLERLKELASNHGQLVMY